MSLKHSCIILLMMINIAILDDDVYQLDRCVKQVEDILNAQNIIFHMDKFNTIQALNAQLQKTAYNLFLLDIKVDDQEHTSIPLGVKINSINKNAQIIFITGYPDYFRDVYERKHAYCILKNELDERLGSALMHAVEEIQNTKLNSFMVKTTHGYKVIKTADILYLEKNLRKVKFILKGNQSVDTYASFNNFLLNLPDYFIQVHRSFIINASYIKSIEGNQITLENNEHIPVSRSFQKNAMRVIFSKYMDSFSK